MSETWFELVVRGEEAAARGFLAGWSAAGGCRLAVLLGADIEVDHGGLGERIRELFASRHQLLFADRASSERLADALGEHGSDAGLAVQSRARILEVSFEIDAQSFSTAGAAAIRSALLEAVPSDVALGDLQQREERPQGASASNLYAPEHPYTYSLQVVVTGQLPGVLEMRRRATAIEGVSASPVRVRTEPVSY